MQPPKKNKTINSLEYYIQQYNGLIYKMARKYVRGHQVELEDLVQEGRIGLAMAVRDFDETRSSDFQTYAMYRIMGKMYEYCVVNDSIVYVPIHICKSSVHVKKIISAAERDIDAMLTQSEIIDIVLTETHPSEKKLSSQAREDIRNLKRKLSNIARNSRVSYKDLARKALDSIMHVIPDDGSVIDDKIHHTLDSSIESSEFLNKMRPEIGERAYVTLTLWCLGLTLKEIAVELYSRGLTKKEISRQAVKASLKTYSVLAQDVLKGLRGEQ